MRIFIGYDSKEAVAYHVLSHSILTRASKPVSIIPLVKSQLADIYTRPRQSTEATEFSFTRFLVPYLCRYSGIALFLDSDMLCQTDIMAILDDVGISDFERYRYPPPWAVAVCKHDYIPKTTKKMDGVVQTIYPRKNWSSLMVFNTDRCRMLTPEYVNTASGAQLHQFEWVPDSQILMIPNEWNYLVGEYPAKPDAKILHYTLGLPFLPGYETCDTGYLWWHEYDAMTRATLQ